MATSRKMSEDRAKEFLDVYLAVDNIEGLGREELDLFSFAEFCPFPPKEVIDLGTLHWSSIDDQFDYAIKFSRLSAWDFPLSSEFLESPKKIWFYFNDKNNVIKVVYDHTFVFSKILWLVNLPPDEIKEKCKEVSHRLKSWRMEKQLDLRARELSHIFPDKSPEEIKDHLRSLSEGS